LLKATCFGSATEPLSSLYSDLTVKTGEALEFGPHELGFQLKTRVKVTLKQATTGLEGD
jgi:hypothetical protein